MGHEDICLWGRTGRRVVWFGFIFLRLILRVVVGDSRSRWSWIVQGSLLLCSDFFCSEKTTARPSGAAHGMLMARFMKIWLALAREAVNLL